MIYLVTTCKKVKHNSPPFRNATHSDFFLRVQYGAGERNSNLQWRDFTTIKDKSFWQHVSLILCDENSTLFYGVLAKQNKHTQKTNPSVVTRNTSGKFRLKALQKYLTISARVSRSLETRNYWETTTDQRRPTNMIIKFSVISWIGSWNLKRD